MKWLLLQAAQLIISMQEMQYNIQSGVLYRKSLLYPISTQNTKNLISGQEEEMENRPKKKLLDRIRCQYSHMIY